MMMVYDSSRTPPSRLDDETVAALRAALRQYLTDTSGQHGLSATLLRVSAEARARAIMPEQLLVVLKDVWGSLPEVRAMTDAAEQVRLLQRAVTMCIEEYYSA
jgi:predicted NACHT family NTPase